MFPIDILFFIVFWFFLKKTIKVKKIITIQKVSTNYKERIEKPQTLCINKENLIFDDIPQQFSTVYLETCKQIRTRSENYDKKHLSQEVSIIGHLAKLVKKNTVIIDAGGGNGELAYKIGKIFPENVVIMIDKAIPPHVLIDDCYIRYECDFSEKVKLDNFLSNYISEENEVVVICKHLCGSGLDYASEYFFNSRIKMDHFLFAMCCCFRIDLTHGYYSQNTEITLDLINKTGWFTDRKNPKYNIGKQYVEKIFNYRIQKYTSYGYNISVCYYVPTEITTYNYLISGTKK